MAYFSEWLSVSVPTVTNSNLNRLNLAVAGRECVWEIQVHNCVFLCLELLIHCFWRTAIKRSFPSYTSERLRQLIHNSSLIHPRPCDRGRERNQSPPPPFPAKENSFFSSVVCVCRNVCIGRGVSLDTGGTKCSQNYSRGLKTRFVSTLDIIKKFFSPKRCIFWRYLLPNWVFSAGATIFDWSTILHGSSRNNSKFTQLFSLGGDRFQSWRVSTFHFPRIFGSPCTTVIGGHGLKAQGGKEGGPSEGGE